jgi:hypothetical protein
LETQETVTSQGKKSNAGGVTLPNFKVYYRAIAIKQHGTGTKTVMKTSGIE